jgi:hypothetical protein
MIFYYEKYSDYILIYNHSLLDKSLPLNGWFHICFICKTISSKEVDYNYKKKAFKIITCPNCQNKFENVEKNELNRYIDRYFIKKIIKK